MAKDFKISQPVEYYRKYLEEDVRPDGRELGEIRPTTINIGSISTAEGSALVKLGNTTVVCGIKGELTTPKSEEPKLGFIVPNVDLPPLCSAQFRPGPPSEQAQVASQFMANVLQCSECLNLEDLCVSEGKLVWLLYCDMMCLDYDGNLLDACTMAMMAALRNCTLPVATINEESGRPEVNYDQQKRLSLLHQPISTTFAIFDDKIIFADPTREEEQLACGVVTVVTLEDDTLCTVHKPGGSTMNDQQLQNCIKRSKSRSKEIVTQIDEIIDNVKR